MMLMADKKEIMDKEDLIEGVSALAGAIVAYFADRFIPNFKYRSIVLGLVGIALIFVGFHGVGHKYADAFVIGFGAVMSVEILSAVPMVNEFKVTL